MRHREPERTGAALPGPPSCPYSAKCVEGLFSEVRRSKRPAEIGSRHPRAAWWHRFRVEMPRPSSIRCSIVYQGVATRNAPTTREFLAHRTGAESNFALKLSENPHERANLLAIRRLIAA